MELNTGKYPILPLHVMLYLPVSMKNGKDLFYYHASLNRHYSDGFPHMELYIAYFKASLVTFSKL